MAEREVPRLQPQVNAVLTTATDDATRTIERTTYGMATATLASAGRQVTITMNPEGEYTISIALNLPSGPAKLMTVRSDVHGHPYTHDERPLAGRG